MNFKCRVIRFESIKQQDKQIGLFILIKLRFSLIYKKNIGAKWVNYLAHFNCTYLTIKMTDTKNRSSAQIDVIEILFLHIGLIGWGETDQNATMHSFDATTPHIRGAGNVGNILNG